ncbi:MAG: hypothetical protein OXN89_04300 [Bryobacterales bacterium]|nr:hypothetical protein [Bryobacterales bacterium]
MDSLDRTRTPLAAAWVSIGVGLARCTDRSKIRLPGIGTDSRRMTNPFGRFPVHARSA